MAAAAEQAGLVEMDVGVDETRQHQPPGGIDLGGLADEFWRNGGDLAAGNADIDRRRRRPGDAGIAEYEIEGAACMAENLAEARPEGSPRLCAIRWQNCSKNVHAIWTMDCRVLEAGESAMPAAAKPEARPMSDAEIVEAYLTASMIPDPDAAAAYMKPGTIITFTGGREFDHPRGPTGFNARRYRWVKKKMDRFDVCPGNGETVVYSVGTLYGEWIDGTPFEGNRYVDRFVVQNGQIVKMDVWNDSAERILVQRGIEA